MARVSKAPSLPLKAHSSSCSGWVTAVLARAGVLSCPALVAWRRGILMLWGQTPEKKRGGIDCHMLSLFFPSVPTRGILFSCRGTERVESSQSMMLTVAQSHGRRYLRMGHNFDSVWLKPQPVPPSFEEIWLVRLGNIPKPWSWGEWSMYLDTFSWGCSYTHLFSLWTPLLSSWTATPKASYSQSLFPSKKALLTSNLYCLPGRHLFPYSASNETSPLTNQNPCIYCALCSQTSASSVKASWPPPQHSSHSVETSSLWQQSYWIAILFAVSPACELLEEDSLSSYFQWPGQHLAHDR